MTIGRPPGARAVVLLSLLVIALPAAPVRGEEMRLEAVQKDVASQWPAVAHLPTKALASRMLDVRDRESVLLIDVREPEEFAVSRLPGAIQVSPGMWRSSFLARYKEQVKGKTVIFYCSVGVRSSRMAASLKGDLIAAGATAVHNLDGGIFAWHNEARPLVDAKGETSYVHPYDSYWGRLLTRRGLVRASPQP